MDIAFAKQNNERLVKSYHCTRWSFPKANGHLSITTERVIFHGATKPAANNQPTNRIVQEVEVKSISGLSCFYGTKINWIWLLLGLVVSVSGLIGMVSSLGIVDKMDRVGYHPPEMLVPAIFGILLGTAALFGGVLIIALLAFGKAFFLNIYSSQSAGAPISLGNADRANHVLLSLCGQPTTSTDFMMKELGALITDLKTDKEEAFKAWGPQVEQKEN